MTNTRRGMMAASSAAGGGSPSEGLFAWGTQTNGRLGNGSADGINTASSPVQIGELTTWSDIGAGQVHSVGVRTDGKLFTWGANSYGELGIGTTTGNSSPVQVGALTTWSKVAAEGKATFGIKTDGTLWAWGSNQWDGKLGLGDATNRSSPVQVGSLTDWSKITSANGNTFAIKTDGTLWAWGGGGRGANGKGNTTTYSSPVQIGSLTTWSDVSGEYGGHQLALRTDGRIFSWGRNTDGVLGTGNTTNYSSPVQIGALTTWSKVASSYYHSAAIKTDGTLWAWGRNTNGVLGDGSTTNRSSPVQIGSLTNWSQVACGRYTSVAIKTDSTLWAWGYGKFIGDNTTVSKSSPIQIGTQANWTSVVTTSKHAFAIASSS